MAWTQEICHNMKALFLILSCFLSFGKFPSTEAWIRESKNIAIAKQFYRKAACICQLSFSEDEFVRIFFFFKIQGYWAVQE